MDSEKVMYWVALGVLALATTTGFVTGHRGWSDTLAERSITVVSQASGMASTYAEIAGLALGRGENDLSDPTPAMVDIQSETQTDVRDEVQNEIETRLACVQGRLARRQPDRARLQAMRVRVRMVERSPRTLVLPRQHVVIEVPQMLFDTF